MAARNLNHPPESPIPDHQRILLGDGGAAIGRRTRRGKVQLRRIEDKNSRQVTFSKRRNGLIKKAQELAVLCDVDVAIIIFSARGRLYDYCSGGSLNDIIERYRIRMEEENAVRRTIHEAQPKQNGFPESSDLKERSDLLQTIQRLLEGGIVDKLSIQELVQLEQRLDNVLRKTRSRKNEIMLEAVSSLQEKEKQLRVDDLMQTEITASLNEQGQEEHRHPTGSLQLEFSPQPDQMNNCATSPEHTMLAFL